MVILCRPPLKGALERPASTAFSFFKRALPDKPSVVTRWPTSNRPAWALLSPDGDVLVEGCLQDGHMVVIATKTMTVNGREFKGQDLLTSMASEANKWGRSFPYTLQYKVGKPQGQWGKGGSKGQRQDDRGAPRHDHPRQDFQQGGASASAAAPAPPAPPIGSGGNRTTGAGSGWLAGGGAPDAWADAAHGRSSSSLGSTTGGGRGLGNKLSR